MQTRHIFLVILTVGVLCGHATGASQIDGSLRLWQPMEVQFEGPNAEEGDVHPNPFLDYRLQVRFTAPDGHAYDIPGFFNGDGKGGGRGNIWSVRFTPDQAGQWTYRASFGQGKQIAVRGHEGSEGITASATAFDGETGSFMVQPCDPQAPGFWRWGRLQYVGQHYLKFADGPYYIKGGCDSPENLLAYADFDGTVASHHYAAHVQDWRPGDPVWQDGKGKGLIGAINYLASQGVNSIYFLVQNIGGDGQDVWPFAGAIDRRGAASNDNLHYDISKLHQWNIVFEHAQRRGIMLHVVLNEAEEMNKRELDNATLGVERKLFYREIVARFGHHNALQWNLSEEYDLSFDLDAEMVKTFAEYLQGVDPYDHPITVHNKGRDPDPSWRPFLGDERFSTTSLQTYQNVAQWGTCVEQWRQLSQAAGRPLPINMDEFLEASRDNMVKIRKEVIWPTYLSGGNLEIIMGSKLQTEDFRSLEELWRWTRFARCFVEENLPFAEMEPDDASVIDASDESGGAQCFAKRGALYAIYYPVALQTGRLTLKNVSGQFEQRWFNPRTGQFVGSPLRFTPADTHEVGSPPSNPEADWGVLVRRLDTN